MGFICELIFLDKGDKPFLEACYITFFISYIIHTFFIGRFNHPYYTKKRYWPIVKTMAESIEIVGSKEILQSINGLYLSTNLYN